MDPAPMVDNMEKATQATAAVMDRPAAPASKPGIFGGVGTFLSDLLLPDIAPPPAPAPAFAALTGSGSGEQSQSGVVLNYSPSVTIASTDEGPAESIEAQVLRALRSNQREVLAMIKEAFRVNERAKF